MATNHLVNYNFEGGHHHQDGIPELVVPDSWRLYYLDGVGFPGIGTSPAYRPESVVWNIQDAPPHERPLFFLDGDYCLKVFKSYGAVYFALTQHVTGLTPGVRYHFTAQVFPDIVQGYDGSDKVWAEDQWAAEARAGWSMPATVWPAGGDGDIEWSEWFNEHNEDMAFGYYNQVYISFIAPATGEIRVWLECKAKWGLLNNAFFFDAWRLEAVDGEPEPPQPEPPITDGDPRIQYERTYVLLPLTADAAWARAVVDGAWDEKRYTIGGSADDAGIGDLDVRRVIAVNPQEWAGPQSLEDFFNEYYPGVTYIEVNASTPDELRDKLAGGLTPVPPEPPEPEPPPIPAGGEKISLHIQQWTSGSDDFKRNMTPAIDYFIKTVKPAAVKLVLNMEDAYRVKSLSRDTTVVYRQWEGHQGQYIRHPDGPQAGARAYLETFLDSLLHNADVIDYVESANEPEGLECGNWEGIQNLVAFDSAFCEELDREGWPARPVLACAAVGNPEHGPETELLLPLARAVVETGGALGYHSYWAVNSDLDYCSMTDGDWEHYAGRALESWDATFAAGGVQPRYLFGEAGAIAISHPGGHMNAGAGWRHDDCLNGDWDKYLAQLLEFRSRLTERVIAATIFTIIELDDESWRYFVPGSAELRALADALAP